MASFEGAFAVYFLLIHASLEHCCRSSSPWVPLQEVLSLPHLQHTRVSRLGTQPEILVQASGLPRAVLSGGIELLKSSSSV